ncbi:hypothetical protein DV515_00010442 [Chloebia gouldiae]|uniref:Lipid-binding serum glycoprotein C-terminal domain-containing protein n=1 Tax=Chloebia gouldiae TaxID=44316 RepID=A0A3L8SAH9_CHLGU|nr:hypothetical protein DV515_00010442 [Chloebia gouldiae]
MVVQDTWTPHQNALNCKTVDINTYVRPRVPVLEEPLKRFLSNALQDLGCNIVNARVKVLSSLLGSRNQVLPLGALGDLPSFSILSGDAIQMDLNLLSENARDGMMTPVQGLPLTASLQLATGRPPQLSLSQDTLSALLEQVQGLEALSLNITSLTGSNFPLQGQLTRALPGSLPLELRVRVSKKPIVTVRDGRATVTLKATIDVASPALQTPQGLLFSVNADIVLNISPSVSDGKLQTSLALDSINLTQFPQSLDISRASALSEWLKKVFTAVYVPSVQGAIRVSVPLPNVLNTNLRNVEVNITDGECAHQGWDMQIPQPHTTPANQPHFPWAAPSFPLLGVAKIRWMSFLARPLWEDPAQEETRCCSLFEAAHAPQALLCCILSLFLSLKCCSVLWLWPEQDRQQPLASFMWESCSAAGCLGVPVATFNIHSQKTEMLGTTVALILLFQ